LARELRRKSRWAAAIGRSILSALFLPAGGLTHPSAPVRIGPLGRIVRLRPWRGLHAGRTRYRGAVGWRGRLIFGGRGARPRRDEHPSCGEEHPRPPGYAPSHHELGRDLQTAWSPPRAPRLHRDCGALHATWWLGRISVDPPRLAPPA